MRAVQSPMDGSTSLATDDALGAASGGEIAESVGGALGRWAGVPVGLRVGIDAVGIRELADMIEGAGPSFVNTCWTTAEQVYCAGSVPRLAARWAAKEATMKALGHGIGEIDPIDIEVVSTEGEPPSLRLHGGAAVFARNLRVGHLALSITHEANVAIAFVAAVDGFDTETGRGSREGRDGRKSSRALSGGVTNDRAAIAEQKGWAH